jgi:hypothetical protein
MRQPTVAPPASNEQHFISVTPAGEAAVPRPGLQLNVELMLWRIRMKRLIAAAAVLGVIAAPAVAATTTAAPTKVTKQVKKTSKLAAKRVKQKSVKK